MVWCLPLLLSLLFDGQVEKIAKSTDDEGKDGDHADDGGSSHGWGVVNWWIGELGNWWAGGFGNQSTSIPINQ